MNTLNLPTSKSNNITAHYDERTYDSKSGNCVPRISGNENTIHHHGVRASKVSWNELMNRKGK